jgi:spore germination cell wall hydrolase CwlJ-like protein
MGVLILNVSYIKAYAAEDITVNQGQESTTEVVTLNQEQESTVEEIIVNLDQEIKTEQVTTSQEPEIKTEEIIANQAQEIKAEVVTANQEQEIKTEEVTIIKEEVKEEVKTEEKSLNKKETAKVVKEVKEKYTKAELRLLSALIYCEAQGESYNGKLAVGIVVLNRVRSNRYPDTVKNVIYQKYQFSPTTNGTLKKALAEYDKGRFTSSSEKDCIKAAKAALNGTKSITVNGKEKSFSKYLSFSGSLKGYTYRVGNHKFK